MRQVLPIPDSTGGGLACHHLQLPGRSSPGMKVTNPVRGPLPATPPFLRKVTDQVTRTLQEILLTEDRRPQVVDDCEQLIDNEVAGKNGASGLAIKASYKIVKAVRPDMIRHASDKLLTDFVP